MQSPRSLVGVFVISLMLGISLNACQTTDSEASGDTHALAFAFAGLSSHVYPDSATWDIAQRHGSGSVLRGSGSSIRIEAAIPQNTISADTIWVSLWTAGIRTAKIPYLYANDSLYLLSGKIIKDTIAWNLLAARDSSKATDLTSLYARLLYKDTRFGGFPMNCPVGIDTGAVKRAGILYAVDSQGWSHGALPSLGMDSLEAATAKTSLTVLPPTFSPASNSSTTALSVTLQCATPGSVIHYTTDNSEPTATSAIYATPISVKNSMTIRALAMKTGMIKSSTTTSTYEITQPSATPRDSILESLTTSPGNFVPKFTPLTLSYTDSVPAGTTTVTLVATARTITDVDSIRYNGTANGNITISKDSTVVDVIVYNKNGNTMKYSVAIIRTKSTSSTPRDSALKSLTTSPGSFAQSFTPLTLSYTDSVPAETMSVTLAATARTSADVDSIRYNGASSGTITISSDTTKVSVIVYNKNRNTMTYSVTIVRLHSTDYGTFKDERDANTYKLVTIGKQTWMASNLNYRDTGTGTRKQADTIGVCYNNSKDSCNKYGRLYTWAEAMRLDTSFNHNIYYETETHGICPSGFHLPSQSEWDTLFTHSDTAAMKSLALNAWAGKVQDTSKFQLQLAGFGTSPGFQQIGQGAYFWTRDQWTSSANANATANEFFIMNGCIKYYQFSVRCVKD